MTNIELTPAELEMVKVKREQEALAKKETEAKQAIQLEKDIKAKEEFIIKMQKQDAAQVAAAKNFADELGGMYKLDITQYNEEVTLKDWTNPTTPKDNGYQSKVVWSKIYTRQIAKITRDAWTITIVEHITYSGRWDHRGTSQGYKMQLNGPEMESNNRYYARASKVNELIKDAIDTIDSRKKYEEAKKSALQTTIDKMQKQYPDAAIITGYDYGKKYIRGGYSTNYEDKFDTVTITFINGVSVRYKVFSDASLGRLDITFPNQKDSWSLMEALSKINLSLDK